MQRVETYILTKDKAKSEYRTLVDLCHRSKNLYNAANYVVRQAITGKLDNIPEYRDLIRSQTKTVTSKKDGSEKAYVQNFISEYNLSKRMASLKQADYVSLKTQCSQQTIALLFKNYKSFFRASTDYFKNRSKYSGRPKMPGYRDKSGLFVLVYTNQSASISKDGYPKLSKDLILKTVRTSITNRNFRQVRIVPKQDYFRIEIVYEKPEGEYVRKAKEKNKKSYNAAIDIGVDNLATATSDNVATRPLIVNGGPLKSINQFYNKMVANINREYDAHGIYQGKKLRKLNRKRDMLVNDYMHKASRRVVDWCILNGVGRLFVGHNSGWKQNADIGRRNNQNFVQIPFNKFIHMVQYKCEEIGVDVELVNEAYTSKCSAFDLEPVCKHDEYCGKREERGLFRTKVGKLVNADVNGSLNILRLGLHSDFKVSALNMNPVKLKKVNELRDVAYFKWQPANRGSVLEPDSVDTDKVCGILSKNDIKETS